MSSCTGEESRCSGDAGGKEGALNWGQGISTTSVLITPPWSPTVSPVPPIPFSAARPAEPLIYLLFFFDAKVKQINHYWFSANDRRLSGVIFNYCQCQGEQAGGGAGVWVWFSGVWQVVICIQMGTSSDRGDMLQGSSISALWGRWKAWSAAPALLESKFCIGDAGPARHLHLLLQWGILPRMLLGAQGCTRWRGCPCAQTGWQSHPGQEAVCVLKRGSFHTHIYHPNSHFFSRQAPETWKPRLSITAFSPWVFSLCSVITKRKQPLGLRSFHCCPTC